MNTFVIAQVLGIFFALAGISMLVNSKATALAVEESVENKGTLWLWGFLAVIVGAVVVVLNNTWTSGLAVLVAIIGWIALVKGAFILIFPGAAVALYKKFSKQWLLVLGGIVALILGIVLLSL